MDAITILTCPAEGARLIGEPGAFVCTACGARYARAGNTVTFLDTPDAFYEGAYRNTIHFVPRSEGVAAWPLWAIHNGYLWQARRHVPAGARVLEFGCAAGVAYFGKRYRMIGLDLSLTSLQGAAGMYDTCLVASAIGRLPLADESVDAVFSAYFWEHMPPEVKPGILAECWRVLRPGGRLIFLYDVETKNPLIRRAREMDAARYDDLFLANDGHIGYQTLAENRECFERCGYRIVAEEPQERTWVQSPSVYTKLRQWPRSGTARVADLIHSAQRPATTRVHTVAVRAVDATVGRLAPEEWARITLTVAEKPA